MTDPDEPTGQGQTDSPAEAEDLATADECAQELLDVGCQQRLWLRALVPLLQLRSQESDPSPRVQLAFDLMHIAAAERISRICRADLESQA